MDVSVIIPVYNGSKFIDECLNSLIAQKTSCQYEIIIVDDGSTDDTFDIAKRWELKDSKIVLVTQANQGPSAARNTGILKSIGDYVLFVDIDDVVSPYYIEHLISNVMREGRGIVVSGIIAKGKRVFDVQNRIYKREYFAQMLKKEDICHNGYSVAKLYNRQQLVNYNIFFDTRIRYAEDLMFYLQAILVSDWVSFIDCYDYTYRINNNSSLILSFNSFDSEYAGFVLLNQILNKYEEYFFVPKEIMEDSYGWLGHFICRSIYTIHMRGNNYIKHFSDRSKLIKATYEDVRLNEILKGSNILEIKDQIVLKLLYNKKYCFLETFVSLYVRLRYNVLYRFLIL